MRCCFAGTIARLQNRLRGQLCAALATTSGNDGTACAGAHAGTETVHLCATAVIGLKRTLAHETLREVCASWHWKSIDGLKLTHLRPYKEFILCTIARRVKAALQQTEIIGRLTAFWTD